MMNLENQCSINEQTISIYKAAITCNWWSQ